MKFNVTVFERTTEDAKDQRLKGNFLVSDIFGAMEMLQKNYPIVYIGSYLGNQEEKKEILKKILEKCKDENVVICTTAYISTDEFPENEYCLERDENNSKTLIPVDEILDREMSILAYVGFVSVNFYTKYQYKIACIYPNSAGLEIIDLFKNLCNEE